jgi:hypothetical protein
MSNEKPNTEAFFNEEIKKDSFPESGKNKSKEKKEEIPDNIDHLAFDKNNWNLDNMPFPDLSMKKQSESKLSIDALDVPNQKLKEYLNEDLLDAIDASPMLTPKNMIKDATNDINIDNNNNPNLIENPEDFNFNNNFFNFSLYNNKNEEEDEIKDINIIKTDEINKIKEDEGGGDINLNNLNNINNNIDNIIQMPKETNNIIIEDKNKIIEQKKQEEKIIEKNIEKNIDKNDKEKKSGNSKEKQNEKINKTNTNNSTNTNNNTNKTYFKGQYQYQIPFIQVPYVTQPIIKSINQMGYENKFDGNKKYQVLVPFTVLKKNVKTKKPFEIREGDWTCSNCNNLNFSFRVKCNRCELAKEQSEQNKTKENKEPKEQKHISTKNKNYYSNPSMNILQYKYYPRYIYIPLQNNQFKQEKK